MRNESAGAQATSRLEDRAFGYLRVPARVAKPRSVGQASVAATGRKGDNDRRGHSGWLLRQMDTLLEAGAYRVLVQGAGIVEDVDKIAEIPLLDIAAHADLGSVVFQAKDDRAQRWFIEHLGLHTNLVVDIHQLINLELARRGLAKRGLVGLVAGAGQGADEG